MSKTTTVQASSFSLPSLLLVLFVGLKLTGHINWSWWWVLSPAWGGLALAIAIVIVTVPIWLVLEARRQNGRRA